MSELLLEIHCEEIPARMQKRAGEDLQKLMTEGLEKAGLTVTGARHFAGPRRLVFIADIPARSPDISEERKGPRVGSPEQALAGFLRGAGLSDISEAEVRTDPKKGEFYVAVIEKAGRDSAEIIAELVPEVMQSFPWPKSMKSGSSSFRWVRPLSAIICVLDGKVVPFDVGGVSSGQTTTGHRRMAKDGFDQIAFTSAQHYESAMEEQGRVMLDGAAREQVILDQARQVCADAGLELVEDPGLLHEVAGLVEWPVVLLGDMNPSFLELPEEVIRLTLKSHQKTFTVRDPNTGKLAPHFIIVANQVAPDGGETIKKGNAKVISARLSDAQFFQTEDAKKKLIDYTPKLADVVFHAKLGTMLDKTERVAALARELAPICGADRDMAEKAARLSKCDLVTQTVIEFTSLQGQIGRLMYEREGGDAAIAAAIEEHYKPQGPSDSVPTDPVSVTVALADKIDTLVGFWAIDEKPTGSKDPYALRRAALGVVRIILENGVRYNLNLIHAATFVYTKKFFPDSDQLNEIFYSVARLPRAERSNEQQKQFEKLKSEIGELYDSQEAKYNIVDLLTFILDRLKGLLRDDGLRHDIIDAVFANGGDDLVDLTARIRALQDFITTEDGANLLAGYKRAANILRAEDKKGALPDLSRPVDQDALSQAEEKDLYTALVTAKAEIDAALAQESYAMGMTALSKLRAPIDAFFDGVMVNVDEIKVRENRLRLLGLIRDTARAIADFEVIEG